jgi:ABC-2 type transport system permease protein
VVGAVKIASIAAKAAPAPSGNAGARAASFRAGMELWREAAERGEPVRELPVSGAKAEGFAGGNPYNQSSPGMLVMFALFGLTSSAGLLVQERREGTLQRLRSTSMRSASILGGHFLAIFAVVMVQAAILVAFGQLALGVDYAAAPFGIGLVVVTLCAFTASAGLLIGSVARDAQQVTLFSLVAMFVLSALGGAWFPLEGAGKAFVAVAKTTPTAWAMTGFQNILVRGQGDATAIIPSVIVALWASALFALAAIRFRRAR